MALMRDWADAACLGQPVGMFYDYDHLRSYARIAAVAEARAVCETCPVRRRCLAEAMAVEQADTRYGMWGGLTASERQELANRLKQEAS